MSEYQYYEFLAVDRPLSVSDQKALRSISTRAEITSTSFTNHYEWGDLKANPINLLKRFFDVFIYVANWGTHRLALKLPLSAFDPGPFEKILGRDLQRAKTHWVLDLCTQDDEPDDDWETGSGRMAALAPIRGELLSGDFRSLYLIWLFRVQNEDVSPNTREPGVPLGLGKLTAAQQELVDFLRIDERLVTAATKQSSPEAAIDFKPWIASLPIAEKDRLLLDVIEGKEAQVEAVLLRKYRQGASKQNSGSQRTAILRTAKDLKDEADRQREKADQAAKRRIELERQRVEVKRTQRLGRLSKRLDHAWADVDRLITTKKQESYTEAITLLRDLRDIATNQKDLKGFQRRIKAIRTRHSGKSRFIRQLRELESKSEAVD